MLNGGVVFRQWEKGLEEEFQDFFVFFEVGFFEIFFEGFFKACVCLVLTACLLEAGSIVLKKIAIVRKYKTL